MGRNAIVALYCGALLGLTSSVANADVVWEGTFEGGDLSEWSYVLNEQIEGSTYAFAQQETVLEGSYAGRIELHNDAVWPNGLKRVELQHGPGAARTAEGSTLWFAWSFYLPEALPDDSTQQIGYWESDQSYQQIMAFEVQGQDIAFYTRQPSNLEQWRMEGVVTPGQWHRIAMGVTWSTDASQGSVDVWFDGNAVVEGAGAQTLADDNPHFVQLGLLRPAVEFGDVPVIFIDDAVEGDTREDVRAEVDPEPGDDESGGDDGDPDTGGGMGGDTAAGDDEGTNPPGDDGDSTGGSNGSGEGSGSGTTASGVMGTGSGCVACRFDKGGEATWTLLGLLVFLRRRRAAN
ncbi:MAG: polysaccharide lyase [Myxococcota bacterium]